MHILRSISQIFHIALHPAPRVANATRLGEFDHARKRIARCIPACARESLVTHHYGYRLRNVKWFGKKQGNSQVRLVDSGLFNFLPECLGHPGNETFLGDQPGVLRAFDGPTVQKIWSCPLRGTLLQKNHPSPPGGGMFITPPAHP